MAYTTTAEVRKLHRLFTVTNIPDESVEAFIADAELEINDVLGLATSLTGTEITQSGVSAAAKYYCAMACCRYDSQIFDSTEEQKSQINYFVGAYKYALSRLTVKRGRGLEPSFKVTSNS